MNKSLLVNMIQNEYLGVRNTVDNGNLCVYILANWDLCFVKLNEDEKNCTIVFYTPWHMEYTEIVIGIKDLKWIHEEICSPINHQCYEIINYGKVETVDDCERILDVLPLPEGRPNKEKVKRHLEAKMLEYQFNKVAARQLQKNINRRKLSKNKGVATIVRESLGDFIKQYDEYGENEITMEVQDVNAKVLEMDLLEYIKKVLESNGYISEKIGFSFGNGHWMTVYVKE